MPICFTELHIYPKALVHKENSGGMQLDLDIQNTPNTTDLFNLWEMVKSQNDFGHQNLLLLPHNCRSLGDTNDILTSPRT